MMFIKIFLCIYVVVYFIFLLIFYFKTKKPFKNFLIFSTFSLIILFIINLTSKFSGIYIPINYFTTGAAVFYGLPGIIALVILRAIFML
ncbi:MAG: pro-sigmaK processing inhibitor BofA family protein [Clostridia bacterium]|nr:pro-sigmaK processing inhibitor BofA family protein [Clostridia bacterium]